MGWKFGYLFAAAALFLPTAARLSEGLNDPVDDIMFFVVGVIVWGTVFNVGRAMWAKLRRKETPQPSLPPVAFFLLVGPPIIVAVIAAAWAGRTSTESITPAQVIFYICMILYFGSIPVVPYLLISKAKNTKNALRLWVIFSALFAFLSLSGSYVHSFYDRPGAPGCVALSSADSSVSQSVSWLAKPAVEWIVGVPRICVD